MTRPKQMFVNFSTIGLVATGLALATAVDSGAEDSVLNPGYITGELNLGDEDVTSLYVNVSSNDGFSAYADFPGAVYDLPVEGDKAYRVLIRGYIPIAGVNSSLTVNSTAYHQVLANAEPTEVNVDRATKRIDATITVVGGKLKSYSVGASASGSFEGANESYQASQAKAGAWGLEETAAFELPMVVDDAVTVSGSAILETDEGLEVHRVLSGVQVDLVSEDENANDAGWLLDLDLPTGSIAGNLLLADALEELDAVLEGANIALNHHRIYSAGNGLSKYTYLYDDGSYSVDGLAAGNYHTSLTTYFQPPYGNLRHPGGPPGDSHAVSPPATTFVDFTPTLGGMAGQLTIEGFHELDDFNGIRLSGSGIAGSATQGGNTSVDVISAGDGGHFVLLATPGEWTPFQLVMNAYDNDDPTDPLSAMIQIDHYARLPAYGGEAVLVSTNEVVEIDPFSATTVETRVFLDVHEQVGPPVFIAQGRVNGSSTIVENGQLVKSRHINAIGPNMAMERPSIRVIAEPGVYAVTVTGKIEGASVTFGKFNLEINEPAPTPASPEGCVGLECHQEVIVSDYLTIDFPNVTVAGVTAVTQGEIGPAPSDDFTVLTEDSGGIVKPMYWDVSTNAQFAPGSELSICFSFKADSVDPNKLAGLEVHQWDAQPELWNKLAEAAGSDPVNGVVCGTTDSLSQFVIGVPTVGGPCNADSDCDDEFPACVDDVCWAGNQDNPCVNDNDCGDAPYCVANLCSAGQANDACLYDNDCSESAPYCAGGFCSAGGVYDSCVYNNDCGLQAPYCAIDQCSEGYVGDLCAYDNDCGLDAPYCAIDQCSQGLAGATCVISNDCSPEAPHCGGEVCNTGIEGDACDAWDGDCSELAPFCVDDQCHDGSLDDPCMYDSDCAGDTPYCANSTQQCTSGEPGSACAYKTDCVSASCNYTSGQCN